jgi:hypothetical protein
MCASSTDKYKHNETGGGGEDNADVHLFKASNNDGKRSYSCYYIRKKIRL